MNNNSLPLIENPLPTSKPSGESGSYQVDVETEQHHMSGAFSGRNQSRNMLAQALEKKISGKSDSSDIKNSPKLGKESKS